MIFYYFLFVNNILNRKKMWREEFGKIDNNEIRQSLCEYSNTEHIFFIDCKDQQFILGPGNFEVPISDWEFVYTPAQWAQNIL